MERNQLGSQSRCAMLRLCETVIDSQVFSIYPAVVSQPIKQRELGLIGSPPARWSDRFAMGPALAIGRAATTKIASTNRAVDLYPENPVGRTSAR
jgi:hypothetical protein